MKKRIRNIFALTLALLMILTLFAGCGNNAATNSEAPSAAPPAAPSSNAPSQAPSAAPSNAPLPLPAPAPENVEFVDHLVLVGGERFPEINAANPAAVTQGCIWIFKMIYDTLFFDLPDGSTVPGLATSWESSDYKTYTLKLRDDVFFHNGEKFKADDVAFSIDRGKNSPGSSINDRFSMVESYNVVSDTEIVITLDKVNIDFIYSLCWPSMGIVNRKAVESDPELGTWIGTGKYKVDDFSSNDYTDFSRNENYWGDVPVTPFITFRTVAEETARMIMLENGEANIVISTHPMYIDSIDANPDLDYKTHTLINIMLLFFNTLNPFTSDYNFRMACQYAMDRDEAALFSRSGFATIPENPIVWGYTTEFRNESLPRVDKDIEKAKEYLAKTNYAGEPIWILTANPFSAICAQVFQANLAEIGINLEINASDTAGLAASGMYGNTEMDIIISGSEWTALASSARPTFYPGMSMNRGSYDNPEIGRLFDEAASTIDRNAREQLYFKIQELADADGAYYNIYHMDQIYGITKGLDGMYLSPNTALNDFGGMYLVKQ